MQVCKPGSVSFKQKLKYIYHLSVRPTQLQLPINWDKTSRLKLQPIWPFNTRGLPNMLITKPVCELLPHIFTITLLPKQKGYLVFCGTFC